jgi:hypothetical protein
MSKYIWYSGATDITGAALAEALGLTGTKTRPRNLQAADIVVGWGSKTKENVNLNGTILNHPDKIRLNRDKFGSLKAMAADAHLAANIADFCEANAVVGQLNNGTLSLPLVGRTKFHQGGKGFWLCLTRQHVDRAIGDGAQYFQTYIDIKDEYRLHVAFGKVIYAVKKTENPTEAGWIAQRKEKVLDYAQKNNVAVDNNTLDYVLGRLVKEAVLPDRIVRSNKRGWKFSSVQLNNVPTALKNAAIKAVGVSGLDFGAVDCAMSADSTAFIIEINSGPGLQGTALQKYVDAFTEKINAIENPLPNVAQKAAKAVAGAAKKAIKAVGAANVDAPAAGDNAGLARLMQNVRNDEEARAVIEALMANRG